MNDLKRDHTNMFRRINFFLTEQAADFAAFAQVAIKKALLVTKIGQIDDADIIATADNTGYAIQKNTLRNNMTAMFLKLSRAISAHYHEVPDFPNRNLYSFQPSQIDAFPDSDFKRKSESVSEKATALGVVVLGAYGIVIGNITSFAADVLTFNGYIPQPLEKRDETKAYGDEVDRLIGLADDIIESLDYHCALAADAAPVVYGEYLNARSIVSSGGGDGVQTFQQPLNASQVKIICNIIYTAAKPMALSNLGSASSIKYYFKLLGVVVGTPVIVLAGATQNVTMATLNVDADELYVENLDTTTATVYKVVIG